MLRNVQTGVVPALTSGRSDARCSVRGNMSLREQRLAGVIAEALFHYCELVVENGFHFELRPSSVAAYRRHALS